MITGTHAVVYAEDAEAARAFLRDVLALPFVDVHDGWLIFKLPPAEVGVHPADAAAGPGHHQLYFTCDDLDATMADLSARGVEFAGEPTAQGWGRVVAMVVPGGGTLGLYQPRHATAFDL